MWAAFSPTTISRAHDAVHISTPCIPAERRYPGHAIPVIIPPPNRGNFSDGSRIQSGGDRDGDLELWRSGLLQPLRVGTNR